MIIRLLANAIMRILSLKDAQNVLLELCVRLAERTETEIDDRIVGMIKDALSRYDNE